MPLHLLVHSARTKADKTLVEVANETGLSRSFLWRLEQGGIKDLKLSSCIALNKSLDISLDRFVESMQHLDK